MRFAHLLLPLLSAGLLVGCPSKDSGDDDDDGGGDGPSDGGGWDLGGGDDSGWSSDGGSSDGGSSDGGSSDGGSSDGGSTDGGGSDGGGTDSGGGDGGGDGGGSSLDGTYTGTLSLEGTLKGHKYIGTCIGDDQTLRIVGTGGGGVLECEWTDGIVSGYPSEVELDLTVSGDLSVTGTGVLDMAGLPMEAEASGEISGGTLGLFITAGSSELGYPFEIEGTAVLRK